MIDHIFTITENCNNLNLIEYAKAHGYQAGVGNQRVLFDIAPDVLISSTWPTYPALTSGKNKPDEWASDTEITLINHGKIIGAPGFSEERGGTALRIDRWIVLLNLGLIAGGGGGGGIGVGPSDIGKCGVPGRNSVGGPAGFWIEGVENIGWDEDKKSNRGLGNEK